jgi:hypothetical protein
MNLDNIQSINQTCKHPLSTTDKYSFIPTTQVLGVLAGHGWHPVQAAEARVVKPENQGYQRHLVRLRRESQSERSLGVGDVLPEIVLVNSHCGDASLWLYAGLMEKVCSNGLIIDRGVAEHYGVPHRGYADGKVEDAIREIVNFIPEALGRRERMKSIRLGRDEQLRFAGVAVELRFDAGTQAVAPEDVLRVRHAGQSEPTLWNILNVVQENLMRGGIPQRSRSGKLLRTRRVQAIGTEVQLNQVLWKLAEVMAETHA